MRKQEWWEVSEKVANREVHENNSRLQQDQKVGFRNVPYNTHHKGFLGQFCSHLAASQQFILYGLFSALEDWAGVSLSSSVSEEMMGF